MPYNNQIIINNLPKINLVLNRFDTNTYSIYFYKILYNFKFLSSDFSFYKFFKKSSLSNLGFKNCENIEYLLIPNNNESLKNSDNNALKFLLSSFFFKKNKIVFFSALNY
jgi:hypothetical protein